MGLPFDFTDGLPPGLVLGKPLEMGKYDETAIFTDSRILVTRKWNGWRVIITITPNTSSHNQDIRIFTDGMNRRMENRVPHIVTNLRQMCIPNWTILVGEAIWELDSKEEQGKVGAIFRHNTTVEKALVAQEIDGKLKILIHGIMCWNNIWIAERPYEEVVDLMNTMFPPANDLWIKPVGRIHCASNDGQELVRSQGWEGLVLYRPDYQFTWKVGDRKASTPRPDGAYKWKLRQDGDFIAVGFRPSENRFKKGSGDPYIKDALMLQHDPINNRLFNCGRFGQFSLTDNEELEQRGEGTIVELTYDYRNPTGKIVEPRFVRFRDDKQPHECVASKSYAPRAEYV